MKKTKLPTSKAKNAYALLTEVRKLILEEPKRYNQRQWLRRLRTGSAAAKSQNAPSCGTIGCVAGWVATLKTPHTFRPKDAGALAEKILGLDEFQAERLFAGDAIDFMTDVDAKPGSRAHAKAGATHIAYFQKDHAAQLKAKAV